MFTGDRSGDWLYRALYRGGLASQEKSTNLKDGLKLHGVYITATCRCAPPDNKPTRDEIESCRPYLDNEYRLLKHIKVILALGKIGFDAALALLNRQGATTPSPRPKFSHRANVYLHKNFPRIIASYHPSQQNTQTGRLTEAMLDAAIDDALEAADA